MVPGATVTHTSYVTRNGVAISAATPPAGNLCVNGVPVSALTVTQRPDLGYTLQGSLPNSTPFGATVGMVYTAVDGETLAKTITLGQVLDPSATLYTPVRQAFDFAIDGVQSAPSSIAAITSIDGFDSGPTLLMDLGGGSYQVSVPVSSPGVSYEVIVKAMQGSILVNRVIRLQPSVEAQPIIEVPVGVPSGSEDPTSLTFGLDKGLRIARKGRPTLRIGR